MAVKEETADVGDRITRLLARKMGHEKAILLIEIELAKIVHGRGDSNGSGAEPRVESAGQNEKSLDLFVYDIIVETPMSLKDLITEIKGKGYKTSSKNFVSCVQQAIQRLKNEAVRGAKAIKDGNSRRYAGIKMNRDVLKKRLSALNQSKRKARADKQRSD